MARTRKSSLVVTQDPIVYTPHCGAGGFLEYVENNHLLVDKTLFIKHFLECFFPISLITRPRRWGKTFNLSILEAFFSIPVDAQGNIDEVALKKKRALFSRFKIGQETQHLERSLGKYPVVLITFKDAKGDTYEEVMTQIGESLADTYKGHAYLLHSSKITLKNKKKFEAYRDREIPFSEASSGLKFLMELLFLHFGKRCVLLIDEYDTPFNMQFAHKILRDQSLNTSDLATKDPQLQTQALEKLLNFFQILLGSSLKGNEKHLERAVVTGILRIARSNLFSAVNNLGEYSILNADDFAEDFGFSEKEIEGLLDQFWSATPEKRSQKQSWLEGAKKWYNGYQICGSTMYNPWSISNWIAKKGALAAYWYQTSQDSLVKIALSRGISKNQVGKLLSGEWLSVSVVWAIALADFQKPSLNEALVWTLLASSGYLTVRSVGKKVEVKIPNYEVLSQFESLFEEEVDAALGLKSEQYQPWMFGLIQGKIPDFCEGMKKGLREIASYHHTKKDLEDPAETFYHGLALGMLLILRDSFILESESESGEGRLDLILIGRPGLTHTGGTRGYVIELKAGQTGDDLKVLVQKGFGQIREKDYTRKFAQYPHLKTVHEISIAFCGKKMEYDSRLMGATTEEEIRELAGKYYSDNWDEMVQRMRLAIQAATQEDDFKSIKNMSDRLEKLQNLKSLPAKKSYKTLTKSKKSGKAFKKGRG